MSSSSNFLLYTSFFPLFSIFSIKSISYFYNHKNKILSSEKLTQRHPSLISVVSASIARQVKRGNADFCEVFPQTSQVTLWPRWRVVGSVMAELGGFVEWLNPIVLIKGSMPIPREVPRGDNQGLLLFSRPSEARMKAFPHRAYLLRLWTTHSRSPGKLADRSDDRIQMEKISAIFNHGPNPKKLNLIGPILRFQNGQ